MSGSVSTSNDWFVSAILKDGTVGHCLNSVVQELNRKRLFVMKLHERISEKTSNGVDTISDISARLTLLESTLKFRLSILSPSRRGAWFRSSASTAAGPFATAFLPDPVFSNYDERNTQKVKTGLMECWSRRNLVSYPLRATDPCLWKTMLSLNFELEALGDLGEFPRLEKLPEELPAEFDSRSLRAFLANVKSEYLSARARLDVTYAELLDASNRFWSDAKGFKAESSPKTGEDDLYDGHRAAEKMRQEFRNRRTTPTIRRPVGKSAQDMEALVFMGFDEFPDAELLKQRYHSLAMEMHPDRQGGNEARFKLLAKSYRHLSRQCGR